MPHHNTLQVGHSCPGLEEGASLLVGVLSGLQLYVLVDISGEIGPSCVWVGDTIGLWPRPCLTSPSCPPFGFVDLPMQGINTAMAGQRSAPLVRQLRSF